MSKARTIESLEKAVEWFDDVIAQHDEAKHGPLSILVAVRDDMRWLAQNLDTYVLPKGVWYTYRPQISDGKLRMIHSRHTEPVSTLYEWELVNGTLYSKVVRNDD